MKLFNFFIVQAMAQMNLFELAEVEAEDYEVDLYEAGNTGSSIVVPGENSKITPSGYARPPKKDEYKKDESKKDKNDKDNDKDKKPVKEQGPTVQSTFDKDPTDGKRPCDYYTFVAEADFTVGAGPANGKVTFTQSSCKESGVKINGLLSLKGKMNGKKKFGWHIHEFGSTANGCGDGETGGHFNPWNAPAGK